MSSDSFMRARRSLFSLQGWRDLVSDSMAIDIGSTSVIIAVRGRGVVADFERTQKMLDQFVRRARSGISHFSRRAVMSVLSGITQVEQRALLAAAESAHIGRVYMVEEGLAAAIGGGTTNVAVVARGMIVYAQAERVGSMDIDEAIINRLRRHHGLIIGMPTAEMLKKELGSAVEPQNPARSLSVKGRDVQTG